MDGYKNGPRNGKDEVRNMTAVRPQCSLPCTKRWRLMCTALFVGGLVTIHLYIAHTRLSAAPVRCGQSSMDIRNRSTATRSREWMNKHEAASDISSDTMAHQTNLASAAASVKVGRSGYWVVVLTNKDICEYAAESFTGWTILLAGTRQDMYQRNDRCVYLNHDLVDSENDIISSRDKAVLYAMKNGAEAIHVLSNGDKQPIYATMPEQQPTGSYLMVQSDGMFNPAQHWGCDIPWDHINPTNISYRLCTDIVPSIYVSAQQILQSEDVDTYETSEMACDKGSPPVILSRTTHTFVGDLEGTLFMEDAFWATAFFDSYEIEERLVLGFILHQVMAANEQYILVNLPNKLPIISVAKGRFDVVNSRVSKLHCKNITDSCLEELLAQSVELGLLSHTTSSRLITWLEALAAANYSWNNISLDAFAYLSKNLKAIRTKTSCERPVRYHPVYYSNPPESRTLANRSVRTPINNIRLNTKLFQEKCANFTNTSNSAVFLSKPDFQFNNILLIVVFNKPIYRAIPYVDILIRPYFPHILYCGPNELDASNSAKITEYNISFISYGKTPSGHFPGALNYKCIKLAAQMGFEFDGYLFAADDIVLLPEKFKELNTSEVWYRSVLTHDLSSGYGCTKGNCTKKDSWMWWNIYKPKIMQALKELESNRTIYPNYEKCLRNLHEVNGGPFRVNGASSDFYYIPGRKVREFYELADVFLKYHVFLEIAVPTVLTCIVPKREMFSLKANLLWGSQRGAMFVNQNVKQNRVKYAYFHPAKWGIVDENRLPAYNKFFCDTVLNTHNL